MQAEHQSPSVLQQDAETRRYLVLSQSPVGQRKVKGLAGIVLPDVEAQAKKGRQFHFDPRAIVKSEFRLSASLCRARTRRDEIGEMHAARSEWPHVAALRSAIHHEVIKTLMNG